MKASSTAAVTRTVTAPTESGVSAVAAVAEELQCAGIEVEDLGLRQPTLDDVFLTLTGSAPAAPADAEQQAEQREPEEALR